jgi:hypothetical protein
MQYSHKYIALFNVSVFRYVGDIDAATKVSSFLQQLLDNQGSRSQRIRKEKDRLLCNTLGTKEMEPQGTESSIGSICTMPLPVLYLWLIFLRPPPSLFSPRDLNIIHYLLRDSTQTQHTAPCPAQILREQLGRFVHPSKQRGNSHK